VNRKELIAAVAGKAGVAEADTDKVLAAFQDVVFDVVADGKDKLSLPGFLTFEQGARAAREGRNPATGETIQIAATKTVKGVGWPGGVSPPGSHGTVRDSLPSHGSSHPGSR